MIDIVSADSFLENVREMGSLFKQGLENFREKYEMTRMLFDAFPDSHEEAAEILARKLDRSEEEILEELYKPWAKRKVAAGHWPAEIERHEERKHQARIVAARLILRYLELSGVSPVRIKEELDNRNYYTTHLDGDDVRDALNADLGFFVKNLES